MKVGGLGEFEPIRKSMQKDEPANASQPGRREGESVSRQDAVQISEKAKLLGKLQQVPDVRRSKIEKTLSELNNGSLMTPEAVKESVARMLENLL